ncbi:MAG: hypothetical protein M3Z33_07480 [Actinomycetota bacterium]|nr:hypothetical protein [Actinomycetota bacterium]
MSSDAPERALAQARERATAARGAGEYAEAERFAALEPAPGDDLFKLHEWAFIEVDPSKIYSTRRFGAPVTLLKRGLLRLLVQYHGQLVADQTRFNLHLLGEVARLQGRVARLEQLAAERDDRP